jgi:hypothetical protein
MAKPTCGHKIYGRDFKGSFKISRQGKPCPGGYSQRAGGTLPFSFPKRGPRVSRIKTCNLFINRFYLVLIMDMLL